MPDSQDKLTGIIMRANMPDLSDNTGNNRVNVPDNNHVPITF